MAKQTTEDMTWKTFHIPLSKGDITLREAYEILKKVGRRQEDVPLIVQIVENPKYENSFFQHLLNPFPGRVNLVYHDYIHILLGRGMLMKDEAFVIGFTMGSNDNMFTWRIMLYTFVARYIYRKPWTFNDEDVRIFWDAAQAGWVSDCIPLSQINFDDYLDITLDEIRHELGIEKDYLREVYKIHVKRYPEDKTLKRILD